MGPILVFDKSFLESLNPDESVWLDAFFLCNITPLFFVETLADLEKAVRDGRTPEAVVGNLAYKTPDLHARPNVHHRALLQAELMGAVAIDMRYGRPIIGGGRRTQLDGQKGVVFQPSPEEEALDRWRRGEFLDLERQQAKGWRRELALLSSEQQRGFFGYLAGDVRPGTLAEAKTRIDSLIDAMDQEQVLRRGLALIGVGEQAQSSVIERWQSAGQPPVASFAPYFRFFYGVELLFYLALSSGLISDRRTNKVDLAYLYYLPFCMVFVSNDKFHAATVPLFLREHQSFVWGPDLKKDLQDLDRHFSALPDPVKERGIYHFASSPPSDRPSLAAALWDRHMRSDWRTSSGESHRTPEAETEVVARIQRAVDSPASADSELMVGSDDLDFMVIRRMVHVKKGKWQRFPPEVLNRPTQ